MFCLLPTLWKQQQIAILIISFFLYVNGIRNEGNNMLQQQQQQHDQQHQQQQPQTQLLHATIQNSNYQRYSSSPNSVFKPSPLVEFTLADATMSQSQEPTYDAPKNPSSTPATSTIRQGPSTSIEKEAVEASITKTKDQHDNRRYSTKYSTSNGGTQFLFPNEQQQVYSIPQQQQQKQEQPYKQQQQQPQPQPHQQYQQQQPPSQSPPQKYQAEQHFTEMPIYIYRDPYTNENYHYTPTEPTTLEAGPQASATYTGSHNDNAAANGYKRQHQQQQLQLHEPATQAQDNQEYLVHSSMSVGAHHPQQKPNPYLTSDKDVYLKRPGLVYDESYLAHPNAVVEKKRDSPQTMKINKISYDSHDYPPPSYAQQQTSNFLPTPGPERPPTPRPTQPPPPPPVRRPSPSFATASPAYTPPRQDYRPRPPPPPPPPPSTQQDFTFGRPQHQQQQYLQSSQNTLPNYANNLDNYLSNKQQGPYYQTERPPPFKLQQQQQQQYQHQQHPYYETGPPSLPPSYRPTPQQQQQSSYPAYESPQYHQQPLHLPSRPSYNNYYDYQIGEVPPQSQGAINYPYPRPPNGPYRPPRPPVQQSSGLASLVQYAPQFTSLLLGGVGGGGDGSSNSPLGSLLGALTGAGNAPQTSTSFNRRPINAQLIRALENIARNDDLQCVPKVVCQMIAAQTQRGQLPSFITSPAITNFLAGFPAASPALIYGRAALLGISGGDKSCHHTYMQCPKNEVEIIHYLNNHRGGFFKFFSEPEPLPAYSEQNQDSSQSSLFSIFAALTGAQQATQPTTPRPRPKPQPAPASDITSTIGNFFTNLLSDYMGEGATVEYQRRRKKRSADRRVRFGNSDEDEDEHYEFNYNIQDYNDEEDSEDTQQNVEFIYQPEYSRDEEQADIETQALVVPKPSETDNRIKFLPDRDNIPEGSGKISEDIKSLIQRFNDFNMGRKLKFPTATTERQYVNVAKDFAKECKGLNENIDEGRNCQQNNIYKADTFKKSSDSKDYPKVNHKLYLDEPKDLSTAESSYVGSKMVFPEREGRIVNSQQSYSAASYSYNHVQQNTREESEHKIVVPGNHRHEELYELYAPQENYLQKPPVNYENNSPVPLHSQWPQGGYKEVTAPAGPNIYNNHVTSMNSLNNYVSNSATNNNNYYGSSLAHGEVKPISPSINYFLPTPVPATDLHNEYTNPLYPNTNYHANMKYYNQLSANLAENSQKYTTSGTNNYNSGNYNLYGPGQNPASSSSSDHNKETYNSYQPVLKPPYSSSTNSGYAPNYNSGNYNNYIHESYPANGGSSSLNAYNSVNTQSYPSNSYWPNNRYHASFYTTRRPWTTTTTARNDNVYVTNGWGETEYYITPDGRKIYL